MLATHLHCDTTSWSAHDRYPISNAITYIQGREDGRTDFTNSLKHYTRVAKGNASLILVENAGHGPMAECLDNGMQSSEDLDCRNAVAQRNLMSKALLGKQIQTEDVESVGPNWALVRHK